MSEPTAENHKRAVKILDEVETLEQHIITIALALDEAEKRGAVAAREKVAQWMIMNSIATGHGDTIEDLLREIPTYSTRNDERKKPGR